MLAGKIRILALVGAVAVGIAAVGGVSTHADETSGRFAMHKTDDGMLRLDTQTGAVSLCTLRDATWSCSRVADDSAGTDTTIVELRAENRKLKDEVERLKADLDTRQDALLDAPRRSIPSDRELDQAFGFVEGILKRFKKLVEGLDDREPSGVPL